MKKLISILGSLAVVASSATTVISCGHKGSGDHPSSIEETILSSTKDISGAMLMNKSENLGLNFADPLNGEPGSFYVNQSSFKLSKNILTKFKTASNSSDATYASEMAKHYADWTSTFSSNTDGSNIYDYVDASSFIESSSIPKANISPDGKTATGGFDKLNYLLSDDTLAKVAAVNVTGKNTYAKANAYYNIAKWSPLNHNQSKEDFYTNTVDDMQSNINDAVGSATSLLKNPQPQGVSMFFRNVSQFLVMANTGGGAYDPSQPGKGVGEVLGWIKGRFDGDNNSGYKPNTNYAMQDAQGDWIGVIPAIFETVYQQAVEMKDELKSQMGADKYAYLFGSDDNIEQHKVGGKYALVDKLDNGTMVEEVINNVNSKNYGGGSILKDGVDVSNSQFFSSSNDGLYGKIINEMGQLKFHNWDNRQADTNGKWLFKPAMDNQNNGEANFADPDLVKLMEDTREVLELSRQTINADTFLEMIKPMANEIKTIAGTVLDGIGIDPEKNLDLLFEVFIAVFDGLIHYKGSTDLKTQSLETIKAEFDGDNNFDESTVNEIRAAADLIKDQNSFFSDDNAAYRTAMYKAMGSDGTKWFSNRAFSNIHDLIVNDTTGKFDDITKDLPDQSELLKKSEPYVDKPLMEGFKIDDDTVTWDKSVSGKINKVEYDIEYQGLGNPNVTKFKTTDELKRMTPEEIYQKLITNDHDFVNNYLGDGLFASIGNVHNKYHVVWINDATEKGVVDMKLKDITSSQAYIENTWYDMQI